MYVPSEVLKIFGVSEGKHQQLPLSNFPLSREVSFVCSLGIQDCINGLMNVGLSARGSVRK